MPVTITKEELARRLRAPGLPLEARGCGSTSGRLPLRHPPIELRNHAVTSLEFNKFAYLYGRDVREFLADEFHKEDSLVALFGRHPEVVPEEDVLWMRFVGPSPSAES